MGTLTTYRYDSLVTIPGIRADRTAFAPYTPMRTCTLLDAFENQLMLLYRPHRL